MSDPSAPSSKLREKRSRKKCPDKQITAPDLWPNIRLHGIRLFIMLYGNKLQGIRLPNIQPLGIMHHGTRLLSISGLSSYLYLPMIVANPSTLKSRRRWKMIYIAMSHLFGCKA
jgi:hypothetical protein